MAIELANDPSARKIERKAPIRLATGGAPPAPTTIAQMTALGVDIVHLYGLSETYGPSASCAWWPEWNQLPAEEQARLKARQGVQTVSIDGAVFVET